MFEVSDDAEGGGDHEEDERDNGEHSGHSVSTWQVHKSQIKGSQTVYNVSTWQVKNTEKRKSNCVQY